MNHAVPSTRRATRGFTLVELLVVLAILAIAAAVLALTAGGGEAQRVRAAARVLAADLQYVQGLAVARHQCYYVRTDPVDDHFALAFKTHDGNGFRDVEGPLDGGPLRIDFGPDGGGGGRGVKMDADTAGLNIFGFDTHGTPVLYPLELEKPQPAERAVVFTLWAGDASSRVRIAPITGQVTVDD